jgi:hypothetical protein
MRSCSRKSANAQARIVKVFERSGPQNGVQRSPVQGRTRWFGNVKENQRLAIHGGSTIAACVRLIKWVRATAGLVLGEEYVGSRRSIPYEYAFTTRLHQATRDAFFSTASP